MSTMFLPGSVADSVLAEAQGRHEAKRIQAFVSRLRSVDSRLDLILATREQPHANLKQGFYYVLYKNDDGTVDFFEISNPDGTYCEPDDRVIEALHKNDWHRQSVRDTYAQTKRAREMSKQRAKDRLREERHDMILDELQFLTRVQMPIASKPFGRQ